jgi:hypothetical protein
MTERSWTVCLFTVSGAARVDKTVRQLCSLPVFQSGQASLRILATSWWGEFPGSLRRMPDWIQLRTHFRQWRALAPDVRLHFLENYRAKIGYLSQVDTDLVVKLDDDILMSTQAWKEYFEAERELDWQSVVAYSPIISTGIPGVELYLDCSVDQAFCDHMRREFVSTRIPDLWGMDYSGLDGTYDAADPNAFLDTAGALPVPYRGIHPIRIRGDLQEAFADYAISNPDSLLPKPEESLHAMKHGHYFCNSVVAVQPSTYESIIRGMDSGGYFDDGFDEVAFNQFIRADDRDVIFNRRIAALHPSYNTIGEQHLEIRDRVFRNLVHGGEN